MSGTMTGPIAHGVTKDLLAIMTEVALSADRAQLSEYVTLEIADENLAWALEYAKGVQLLSRDAVRQLTKLHAVIHQEAMDAREAVQE